jgi:hypothetical protein
VWPRESPVPVYSGGREDERAINRSVESTEFAQPAACQDPEPAPHPTRDGGTPGDHGEVHALGHVPGLLAGPTQTWMLVHPRTSNCAWRYGKVRQRDTAAVPAGVANCTRCGSLVLVRGAYDLYGLKR